MNVLLKIAVSHTTARRDVAVLALFLALPFLLLSGWNFWVSLGASCIITVVVYLAMIWTLGRMGLHG